MYFIAIKVYCTWQLLGNPALVPITALETHGGQPAVFAQVLADMMQQETGDLLITSDAVHPTQLHDALVWHPAKSSHYFYTSVKCEYTFCSDS